MTARREIRIGTRGSKLALWQANTVAERLSAAGSPTCRLVIVKTSGDRLQDAPLSEIGGKRLFVKEIEDALLAGEVDIAVHSSKDMPAVLPDGLAIIGVLPREDPRDAIVLGSSNSNPQPASVAALAASISASATIGTGSVRRIAQLRPVLSGATFAPIRGNLDTRLRKLDEGGYDALVLAAAGLRRLGFGERISMLLPIAACVPAPGQGIVAIEARTDAPDLKALAAHINDPDAHAALIAERSVVEALGGGCQTPIGALAAPTGEAGELELQAIVTSLDGSRIIRASARARSAEARALGLDVASQLRAGGATEILAAAAASRDAETH